MRKLSHSMDAALMSLRVCATVCSMLTGYMYNFGQSKTFVLHPSTVMSQT